MLKQLVISAILMASLATSAVYARNHDSAKEYYERGEIVYLTGGVGRDEQEMMKAEAEKYNTRMSFAQHENGGFISGVEVTLLDAKGKVLLRRLSDGPYFYIALPKGKYTLKANHWGRVKVKTLNNTSAKYDSGMIRFTWKQMSDTSPAE